MVPWSDAIGGRPKEDVPTATDALKWELYQFVGRLPLSHHGESESTIVVKGRGSSPNLRLYDTLEGTGVRVIVGNARVGVLWPLLNDKPPRPDELNEGYED